MGGPSAGADGKRAAPRERTSCPGGAASGGSGQAAPRWETDRAPAENTVGTPAAPWYNEESKPAWRSVHGADPAFGRRHCAGTGHGHGAANTEYGDRRLPHAGEARRALAETAFVLLILDVNLPDGSGLDLLRAQKALRPELPVILLTANDLELDEVAGLESGADDYITKPFSLAVLRARVNARLRRPGAVRRGAESWRFPPSFSTLSAWSTASTARPLS